MNEKLMDVYHGAGWSSNERATPGQLGCGVSRVQCVDRQIDTPQGKLARRNIERKIAYGLAST